MNLLTKIPPVWQAALGEACNSKEVSKLSAFLESEIQAGKTIFPAEPDWFRALDFVEPENVSVVILGQDPYHGVGEAHGLSFSVPFGVKTPPSLRNIWQEIARDLGVNPPQHGNLNAWAQQGVLLLNTSLTVEANKAGSHAKKGWEVLTDAIIAYVANTQPNVVFMLWGAHAQKKANLIHSKHCILTSVHPSPLSAYRGFIGCGHFSAANAYLQQYGKKVIDWGNV